MNSKNSKMGRLSENRQIQGAQILKECSVLRYAAMTRQFAATQKLAAFCATIIVW
jgi:hypothetical protein